MQIKVIKLYVIEKMQEKYHNLKLKMQEMVIILLKIKIINIVQMKVIKLNVIDRLVQNGKNLNLND